MKLLYWLWNWCAEFCRKTQKAVAKTAAAAAMENTGEINIVAMVLIIIVVIALVAIFRSEMTDIVTKMFEKIRSGMEV